MRKRPVFYKLLLGVAVLSLVFGIRAYAGIDAMALRLLEPYRMPLRWDNIEDEPYWLSGVKPVYNDAWEMETIRLTENRQVTVFLPAYETLRLYRPDRAMTEQMIDVYSSDGSGLGLKQTLKPSTDGRSFVLSPDSDKPLLIRIQKKCCQSGELEFALFVSRKDRLNDIAPYRGLLWSSSGWCLLRQQSFSLPELYNRLPARQAQSFNVSGPVRIVLKSRLDFERTAGEMEQYFRIEYWFDENRTKQGEIVATELEKRRLIFVNEEVEVVGREEQLYIEVPPGDHRLYLQSDRPIYAQLLAQTEQDYLLRGLNNPKMPVEDIRSRNLLPSTALKSAEHKAKTLAWDNRRQSGTLAAGQSIREAALSRPDYPDAMTEAEHLRRSSSLYRNLLPSKKADSADQYMAYFLPRALQSETRAGRPSILPEQFQADALKGLSHGFFTRLTQQDSRNANEYTLPEQQTEGQLRIVIDKRSCLPGVLHIEINREIKNDLPLDCEPVVKPNDAARSINETAWLNAKSMSDPIPATLGPFFAAFSEPAPLIPAAVLEMPLPPSARTVTLRQRSTAEPGLHVALQYRAGKAFTLSEQSYLSLLDSFTGSNDLQTKFIGFLAQKDDASSDNNRISSTSPAAHELMNQWVEIKRLLLSEFNAYRASVASIARQNEKPGRRANTDTLRKSALDAEAQSFWLEALEYWGDIAGQSDGSERNRAQLHQAGLLKKLGEDYLAENLLRYLSLNADAETAEDAQTQLNENYRAQNNETGLLTLSASMFIHRPTEAHAIRLFDALMTNGEYRFALIVGLVYAGVLPIESRITAAYRLEWWETYERLQNTMTPTQQAFAKGLKAQHFADFQGALSAWTGSALDNWRDYLQQGLQLRRLLSLGTEKNAQALYRQWADWQQKNPGTRVWENATRLIKDYAASDTYYHVERDAYLSAFRGNPDRPVVLKLLGPATLNLRVRPMHPIAQQEIGLDGWLDIVDNGEPYRYPYQNNTVSRGINVIGSNDFRAGNAVELTYRVGLGWHEIKLSSEQAPISMTVRERRPELALDVLPPLTDYTWPAMLSVKQTDFSRLSAGQP